MDSENSPSTDVNKLFLNRQALNRFIIAFLKVLLRGLSTKIVDKSNILIEDLLL